MRTGISNCQTILMRRSGGIAYKRLRFIVAAGACRHFLCAVFMAHLLHLCSSLPPRSVLLCASSSHSPPPPPVLVQVDTQIVVSYSRSSLGQTGDGHFSPIGGYHKERQLLLILDVARFKYPPYWVSVDDLWQAMMCHDEETHRSRGYVLLNASEEKFNAEVCRHGDQEQLHWEKVKEFFTITLPIRVGDVFVESYSKERLRYNSALAYFISTWLSNITPDVLSSFKSHMQVC